MLTKHMLATALIVLAILPLALKSTEAAPEPIEKGTPAVAIKKEAARYPESRRKRGQEGWVELSYVVTTQGTVDDVVVSDSSGVAAFERAAVAATKKWQYKPASYNGELVEQSESRVRVVFTLDPSSKGARKDFVRKYKKVLTLLEEGNDVDARLINQELIDGDTHNLYESAWLNMLQFRLSQNQASDTEKLNYLRKALFENGAYVPKSAYVNLMQAKFLLEVKQGRYTDAMRTHEQLATREGTEATVKKLDSYAKQIDDLIASNKEFSVPIAIDERGIWRHDLLHRTFSFQRIAGDVEKFEVRCSRKYSVFEFSTDNEYQVPASWGECAVYLYGEADVKASMMQFPSSA